MFNSTIQSSGASYAQALNCSVSDVSVRNSQSIFSDKIVNWLCQKSCLQDKTVAELKDAYSNDAYLNEGIGKK